MKQIKRLIGILTILMGFLLIGVFLITIVNQYMSPPSKINKYDKVKRYEPMLSAELHKYHLEEYTSVLLALMYQESRGEGGDPMQASESAGLPPNTINDPERSIRQGVRHFNDVLTYGKEKKVDFPTIIQAYNMGKGYITFVAEHGKKHTEDLAKQFSSIQVKKQPTVYNCGGDQNNFRYPYCYGDFSYTTKVLAKVDYMKQVDK
ncbi:lysozyme family protein [Aneurinibacillus aneurinilyticus]|uniref:Lysozyme family protein n=2 Tax=Aneurinibacillus aneurinilyticus TaxID=1391 RepID=A0A848D587_ANEAE|nr:lysozyme family protein [Aneurinibacillus aneurinilyticus]ERI11644.1 hypothetical protein HMPREF0083_00262 [Aneurinibacillus aneurinilyticus ATCC 12856]MCI1695469.1 lysozyme family protein [Aneurinibacillus aneurinilyticus]MED0673205.1 lysozyme family protein [Aneurinibacillus aneurinilyticus]MED0706780.1 lysozyme family protein [Aneurinibacillus aneurinilyticus]MED0725742.1 lysozyme family protein [Aneurinibacillus aneurinilyticus]